MRTIKYLFSSCFCLITFISFAQTNVPYWQQEVNYVINVSLDDQKHILHGFEEIEYINNSPDDLEFIYFHLWPNAYKNNQTAFAKQKALTNDHRYLFATKAQRGYIDSLDFKVNGKPVEWKLDAEHIDICKIHLNQPLKSGQKITISTPFRVKIPDSYSRLGHVGQQYQITQWYPKPAVYDKDGWHQMPYLDMGEFYSEFGTFDVSITLPENYVVAATGVLQNDQEQQFLDSIAYEDWQTALFRYSIDMQRSSPRTKTIRYIQEQVHDFAWFADKTYKVMFGEIELPHSGRTVKLEAFFNDRSYEVWQDIIQYMQDAVYYYSLWIGDYPYDVVTVVDGALSAGSGMEYPTITVLGGSDKFSLELVTMHEIGHNWFYGILGTNERDHAWMDEGINSYYERRYISTKYPEKKITEMVPGLIESSSLARWVADRTRISEIPYTDLYRQAYFMQARQNKDQPANLHADLFTYGNYFAMVYQKPAMIFKHLENYLGVNEFDRIMQLFFETWKFKHPQPDDLQNLFESETGKNLDWLFDGLINSDKKLQYSIRSTKKVGEDLNVVIQNEGGIAAPFPLATFSNSQREINNWVEGFEGTETITLAGAGNAEYVVIDPDTVTLQLYPAKGRVSTSGFFKKAGPLKVHFPGAVEDPDINQVFIIPTLGMNTNDKFMLGFGVYNRLFPQKKFNYFIMPMYSFGLEKLSGSAEINYNLYPNQLFRRIKISGLGKSYAGYTKIEPNIELIFKPRSLKFSPLQKLNFRYAFIQVDQEALPQYEENYEIFEGKYSLEKSLGRWQYGLTTGLKHKVDGFLSWENEGFVSWKYYKNSRLKSRIFYGKFLKDKPVETAFQYGLSGSLDYSMDDVFLDRATISHDFKGFETQTNLKHGGFRGWVPVFSDSWMFATNFDVDIPYVGLFNLFADVGVAGNDSKVYYDAGIRLSLIRNVLEFYFPVIGDAYEKKSPESFRDFTNHFRFRLRLNNINPLNSLYRD